MGRMNSFQLHISGVFLLLLAINPAHLMAQVAPQGLGGRVAAAGGKNYERRLDGNRSHSLQHAEFSRGLRSELGT
jgi:hypothetical protein